MNHKPVHAILLAGGRGERMGGRDKGLVALAGRPLVEWVLEAVTPQVDSTVISANRNFEQYQSYGLPVVPDGDGEDFQGPLAGVAAALAGIGPGDVLVVPVDTPVLPADLLERLRSARDRAGAQIAFASQGGRAQYAIMLFDAELGDSLTQYLASGGRSIRGWADRLTQVTVDFAEGLSNINDVQDLEAVTKSLMTGGS